MNNIRGSIENALELANILRIKMLWACGWHQFMHRASSIHRTTRLATDWIQKESYTSLRLHFQTWKCNVLTVPLHIKQAILLFKLLSTKLCFFLIHCIKSLEPLCLFLLISGLNTEFKKKWPKQNSSNSNLIRGFSDFFSPLKIM